MQLVDYSPRWPSLYDAEADNLRAIFGLDPIGIEHIGSTSVPGLKAKPIIDILLGADSLEAIERHIQALESTEYRYVPEFERQIPHRRYFVKPGQGAAQYHLHAVVRDGEFWRDHVLFRDALRCNADLRERYRTLKEQLAASLDRAAYTDAKTPFILGVLDEIKQRSQQLVQQGGQE